ESSFGQLSSGHPVGYLVRGRQLWLAPVDDTTTVKIIYYQTIPSITVSGMIGALGAITAGSGYVQGTYDGVPLTGGTGAGAKASMVVGTGGTVIDVRLTTVGSGYVIADSLSASNANLGGSGSAFAIPVSTINTNWIMTSHPDLYLFGVLAEAELLTDDPQTSQ